MSSGDTPDDRDVQLLSCVRRTVQCTVYVRQHNLGLWTIRRVKGVRGRHYVFMTLLSDFYVLLNRGLYYIVLIMI